MNCRKHGPTLGVLTPHLGGFYHGSVLAGIHRMAAARNVPVVAIHTLGTDLDWQDEPGALPLGISALDGFITVNDFRSEHVLSAISEQGKPLVCIGAKRSRPDCCKVLPDNAQGTRAAVLHLAQHGHRRIGFAGYMENSDVAERFDGYRAALEEAEIPFCEDLVFTCTSSLELDGRDVGRLLLAQGLPCSALVVGTDKNALGIMFELRESGRRVPDDLAIIGFDDIEGAQYSDPPLATVRQRFDLLGEKAVEVILSQLIGGEPMPDVVRSPTLLIPRRSCGCALANSRPPCEIPATTTGHSAALHQALRDAAMSRHMVEVSFEMWPGAGQIVEQLVAIAEERATKPFPFESVWDGFLRVNRDVESIDGVMGLLDDAARTWPTEPARLPALLSFVRQLRVELMRSWRSIEQVRSADYDYFLEANAKINVSLSGTDFLRLKDLSWLRWTRMHYGSLALWQPAADGSGRRLQIISEYQPSATRANLVDQLCAPECFPPLEMQNEVARSSEGDVLMIVPVPGPNGNQGLLAVAGPVEVELREHVGNVRDWGVLIGTALERSQTEERLKRAALRDALTGLPNRVLLLEGMQKAMANARRVAERRFAILILDLDGFKTINDSVGHFAGDRLLIEVAHRLERAIREADTIARLGGDEFAIIVHDVVNQSDIVALIERISRALRQPFVLNGDPFVISASIGVALSSDHYTLPAAMLRDADIAMYRAKRSGRSRYQIFNSSMHEEAVQRLRLESQLQQALQRDEFVLYFQPIFSLESGDLRGAEALIRWQHPQHGCLAPGRFLSTAEEAGLAVPLSKWVIESACREIVQTISVGHLPLRVNINVPVEHLSQPDFVDFVRGALERYSVPAGSLGIELVESSLIENRAHTVHVLERLREIGVSTYIDDFGTGYSSLSYLQCLPVTGLKIDRGFISDVDTRAQHAAIVTAIVTMARSLGLTVVAEGVERASQLEFVRSVGCDMAQGYLFSQPLPSGEWARYCESLLDGMASGNRQTYEAISMARIAVGGG